MDKITVMSLVLKLQSRHLLSHEHRLTLINHDGKKIVDRKAPPLAERTLIAVAIEEKQFL